MLTAESSVGALAPDEKLSHGFGDVLCVYAVGIQEFLGLARAGHLGDGEVPELDGLAAGLGEGREDGLAHAALGPVVLDHDHAVAGGPDGGPDTGGVDGLYRVAVDDAHGDVL